LSAENTAHRHNWPSGKGELRRTLAPLGRVIAVDCAALDLTKPDSIRALIRGAKPNLIVNAAAYTAVDKAESEPGLAMAINGVAPGIMMEEAKRLGATIIHYSTDYVFDGTKLGLSSFEDVAQQIRAQMQRERARKH
jgi:dTDP-4-dehydrorhamnose reductase